MESTLVGYKELADTILYLSFDFGPDFMLPIFLHLSSCKPLFFNMLWRKVIYVEPGMKNKVLDELAGSGNICRMLIISSQDPSSELGSLS